MRLHLLDVNVLIALAWPQHVHHRQAHTWFKTTGNKAWATCPLTELAFVRISSNPRIIESAVSPRDAAALLKQMTALPNHHFWPDDLPGHAALTPRSLAMVGHRQVNDAYLLALASKHDGKLATFDRGIADLEPDEERRERHIALLM